MARTVPCELIFNPNWWFQNYGVLFTEPFYFDRSLRIQYDLRMRQAMHERFGLGETNLQMRPVVGSQYVAGGFVIPAMLGCPVSFQPNEAPSVTPRNLAAAEVLELKLPDLDATWPMNRLLADMDGLECEFGWVCGDFDLDGVLNTALHVRGQDLFTDFYEAPQVAHHLLSLVTELQIAVARRVRARTGTCSVATNRSILNVDPSIVLHSNCSVQMVSPKIYDEFLFPYEKILAEALPPYGIHHCGNNAHTYASAYNRLPVAFLDVGWGSDVAQCRKELPSAFLNLRLSPVRLLQCNTHEIQQDAEKLLGSAMSHHNLGLCCINMDYGTPDENVRAILNVASSAT